jgi:hypothetical protein
MGVTAPDSQRWRAATMTRFGRLFLTAAALVVGGAPILAAQATGRVTGRVVDSSGGTPLAGATVELLTGGMTRTTQTAIDGRFQFPGLPAGPVTLRARMIGYGGKTVTGMTLAAGAVATQDIALAAQTVELEELTVTAESERGSVSEALGNQRANVSVMNSITAEQIARSPDGDAAAAVQRVSGVTVQEGKFIFVRGLGERYTTTSLNGARIPSPEPERKVVPLDLFPSGILQTITTAKTFTPDLSGDFSGAQVDIQTREFPAERRMSLSMSVGGNDAATGQTVLRAPSAGSEQFTFGAGPRRLPRLVQSTDGLATAVGQDQANSVVGAFRNVWSAPQGTGTPNSSLGLSIGGNDPVLGQRIGYLLSGTYSYGQEIRVDERRAVAKPTSDPAVQDAVNQYVGTTGRATAMLGGLASLSTLLGSHSRLALNATYTRTADNEARRETGDDENLGVGLQIDRLRYVERAVMSAQLLGEHQLARRHQLDWALSRSRVSRVEPDRSELVYALDPDPQGNPQPAAWLSASSEGAVRTFGDLSENSTEAQLSHRLLLGGLASPVQLKVGGAARRSNRLAENVAYSISSSLPREQRELPAEQIFDGRFNQPGDAWFSVSALGGGGTYDAEETVTAGFAMLQVPLGPVIELVGGARYERSATTVRTTPTSGDVVETAPEYEDLLPSLAMNLRIGEAHVLRLSASRTLSRPEYRELAPVQYREVIGGENVVGNADLRRALIQNYDVRWEWYPRATEVLSIGLFAKSFDDPIERIYLATSGTRLVTFVNAESAVNYGVEIEVRKNLDLLGEQLRPFQIFANATVMHSEIEIGDGAASKLNDRRAMVGQAPYVFNTGLTYTSGGGQFSATALYNVVGARIVSAAEAPLPDIFEQPRHMLDLALRFPVLPGLSGKADFRNLLDAASQVRQGTVTREYYRSGRSLSVGLNWQP